ncbi:MAG: DUF1049 domain-containing protein [Geobacteraceae bacterium]|nr:DUF1049 domain-containing protein [Geobacteraceae bacterium]
MRPRKLKIKTSRPYTAPCRLLVPLRESRTAALEISGFSLVELIVILAILGLLMIVAMPTWSYMVTNSKISRAQADIRTLEKEITAYLIEKGTLPPNLHAIGRGDLLDPWKRPYQYVNFSLGGTPYQDDMTNDLNTDFDIYSTGQDGNSAQSLSDPSCQDDIVRAGDGGYVGLGQNF